MKKVKSLLALLLALMLVFSLVGCDSATTTDDDDDEKEEKKEMTVTEKAEEAVENGLYAFKKADFEKVAEYFGGDVEALDEEQKEILTPLLEKVEYKVLNSEEIDDETVKVTVEITTVDLEAVFEALMEKAYENPDMSEEEVMELFKELVSDKDAKTVTAEVDVEVKVDGDECKLEGSDELVSALFGGAEDLF